VDAWPGCPLGSTPVSGAVAFREITALVMNNLHIYTKNKFSRKYFSKFPATDEQQSRRNHSQMIGTE
jgi:hypothetical protein